MTRLDFYHRWYHSAPNLHKSLGALIFFMLLVRLAVKLRSGLPSFFTLFQSLKWEAFGKDHLFLYLFLLIIVLSGFTFATSKGDPLSVFGLFEVPSLFKLGKKGQEVVDWIHYLIAYGTAFIILLHAWQKQKQRIKLRKMAKAGS